MGLKEEGSLRYSGLILTMILVLGLLLLLIFYYIFLLTRFDIGDYVLIKDTNQIGRIDGLSLFKAGYLEKLSTGEYISTPFWKISSLSQIQNYNLIYTQAKIVNVSKGYTYDPNFKKEDSFNDYIISQDVNFSGKYNLIYLGISNNLSYFNSNLDCTPDFSCSDWGECHAEYTLRNILNNESVQGISYRFCQDSKGCFPNLIDSKVCEDKVVITTQVKTWCNKEYLEVIDGYGRVLARLNNNDRSNYMDISLNVFDRGYCYYCFDGKKDFDETGKDCGGSCFACTSKKK